MEFDGHQAWITYSPSRGILTLNLARSLTCLGWVNL